MRIYRVTARSRAAMMEAEHAGPSDMLLILLKFVLVLGCMHAAPWLIGAPPGPSQRFVDGNLSRTSYVRRLT